MSGALRIERIRVVDFRGIRDRAIRFADAGVTVVEGPNETGKSSLADALDLLLDYKDSSHHRDVLAAQPVGTDAGPMVEADLRAGPYRFTYRKRWVRDRETSLVVREPRPEQQAGDAAHDRVLAILAEHADLGLWRALRLLQGEKVVPAHVEAAGSLGAALERAAGGSDPAEEGGLFDRVRAESELYWTAATGRPRDLLTAAEADVAVRERAVTDLRAAVASVEADADALARATAELAGMHETTAAQEAVVRDREARAAEVDRLAAAAALRKAAHDAAVARADEVAAAAKRRADLVAQQTDASTRRDALVAADAEAAGRRADVEAALEAASRALEEARGARARAAEVLAMRRAERDLLRDRADLVAARDRKSRLDRHAEEGRAAQAAVETNP
ncbi:MAG: AAA family ATPase, partial [Chloroflexi bacterium]|nr:AAA family ATPase [Chloroflexota bacterium]